MMHASLLKLWMSLLIALCVTAGVIGCKAEDTNKEKDKQEEKKDKDKSKVKKKNDKDKYTDLFNGKDLTDWDGDPRLWSVKDGVIVGQTTAENPAADNTFLIWRGGTLKDFKLKLKFKIHNGNSGVQYRAKPFGDPNLEADKWKIAGYQAEVSNKRPDPLIGTGFLYHERGRGDIAHIGEFVVIDTSGTRTVVGKIADPVALEQKPYYNEADWNEYTIIARGNHLTHLVNGYQTIEMIDNDAQNAAREGLLALQIHVGEPMIVEFKDIRMETYDDTDRKFNENSDRGWVTAP